MDSELPLRIVVEKPPRGVIFRLQRGGSGLVEPTSVSSDTIVFDFTVRVGKSRPDGFPNALGEFAQGTPADRFVYINSGTLAGQPDSCWSRRAKVRVADITWQMIERVLATLGATLEARIAGTAQDGGPACATVPLLNGGWVVNEPDE